MGLLAQDRHFPDNIVHRRFHPPYLHHGRLHVGTALPGKFAVLRSPPLRLAGAVADLIDIERELFHLGHHRGGRLGLMVRAGLNLRRRGGELRRGGGELIGLAADIADNLLQFLR